MKAIFCEVCGSNDLVKQNGVFVCQHCGTKYSLEDVKKLYVEVGGSVKIDSSDEINNLFTLARRARGERNYENAKKYYEQILIKDSSSWEASFYYMYCSAMIVNRSNFSDTIVSIVNGVDTIFSLIRRSAFVDAGEERRIVNEVVKRMIEIVNYLIRLNYNFSIDLYDAYSNNGYNILLILANTGDCLFYYFGDSYKDLVCKSWKLFIQKLLLFLKKNITNSVAYDAVDKGKKYVNKIQRYDSSYELPLVLEYYFYYRHRSFIILLIVLFLLMIISRF